MLGMEASDFLIYPACRLFTMAWPLAAQNVFAQGSFYISMAFAGRLGRDQLSAAVLGTSILNVTGFAALAGLASAMETLCGQVSSCKACQYKHFYRLH